ncbi:MAG: glyceraldehyde 3-phosphate dehydrogenase NAD-binding domain-containing protein [Candidatus Babeliaceae bacterium]
MNIALNGFGRIGKTFLRVLCDDQKALKSLKVVAINVGPADAQAIAYMFKYDSLMGAYKGVVEYRDNQLIIDGYAIKVYAECDPQKLPWKTLQIDWVVEASGHFTDRKTAEYHFTCGAKKVLITAPAHDEDVSIIPGVNNAAYNAKKHAIVSLGSCTTNAFLPLLKVIHENFGIEQAVMTTAHAYTNSQQLLDGNATMKDLRRSRAAALNMVPSTTGAQKMVDKIMPELAGKVEAIALRIPIPVVSLIDLSFIARKKLSAETINKTFERTAQKELKHILALSYEPLVSSDYEGNPYSVTVDGTLTYAHNQLGKVFGWYDNEWGYSCRLKDFLMNIA